MMKSLAVLAVVLGLMPGCCMVGMTVGGSRATAHNDEVARKLERGEQLDADDKEASVGGEALTGFAVGAAIDIAVVAVVTSLAFRNWNTNSVNSSFYGD